MEQVIVEKEDLLVVNDLKKHYPIKNGIFGKKTGEIKAVDGVSFTVKKGETFCIVGESGCGKSTVGMSLLRLIEPTSGNVLYNDKDMVTNSKSELRELRKHIQIIFQDTYSSLNPKHTIKKIISEPLVINTKMTNSEIEDRVIELLNVVGLSSLHLDRYPHEFSGGQRQRIGIARALALNPELIVCDEPVSALDVSIQSQILNLLEELQEKFKLTYIFISHDLSVVEHISDQVAVMYLGRVVEIGSREEVFQNTQHPYTKALMSSVPIADPKLKDKKQRIILTGDVPSPKNPPKGCHFHTRCPFKTEKCEEVYPEFKNISDTHKAACHLI